MKITITINGATELSRALRDVAVDMKNLKPVLSESIDVIEERKDEIFKTQGRNLEKSPAWKGLSATTNQARQKRWGYYKKAPSSPGILRWTGNLQDNITKKSNDTSASMTFNADYAGYHQSGGGKLAKRALIDLNEKTNEKIVKVFQKSVEKSLQQRFK